MKKFSTNHAVSEVIGIVLMLGMALLLFSLLYVFVFSYPFPENTPSARLVGAIGEEENTTYITIVHLGGSPLSLDSKVMIPSGNGTELLTLIVRGYVNDINGDGYWGIGEELRYPWNNNNIANTADIQFSVIDPASNSIVMTGLFPIPYLSTVVDPIFSSSQPVTATSLGDISPTDVTLWYRFGSIWKDDFIDQSYVLSSHNMIFSDGYVTSNPVTLPITDFVDDNESDVDNSPDKGTHSYFFGERAIGAGYDVLREANTGITYYVNQISNVDNSSDQGTHSNFLNMKTIDGVFDVLTEKNMGVENKDPVDSNTCNVQAPSDVGIETNFNNAQDSIRDSDVMTIQEANIGGQDHKDPVDSDSSNVDSVADIGFETNFINSQDISRDSNYMTIQEVTQDVVENEAQNFVDSLSDSYSPSDIGTHSSFAEMQDLDGTYDLLTESNSGQVTYVGAGSGDGATGYSSYPTPTYPSSLEEDDLILLQVTVRDTSNTPTTPADFTLLYGPDSTGTGRQWIYYKFSDGTESGSLTVIIGGSATKMARMYAFRNVIDSSFTEGGGYRYNADSSTILAQSVTTSGEKRLVVSFVFVNDNNGLDAFSGETGGDWQEAVTEYPYNGPDYGDDGCIQLQTAAMSTAGTISGGSDSMSDSDPWGVRAFALKPKIINDYRLDLEVRWTTADYNEANEFLCIYGGEQDSEALQVDVRYGGAWIPVIADVQPGWNNVSVSSYLTSSSFYIRFVDTAQSGDTSQNSWNVEGVLLHTWSTTTTNQIDFEYQWTAAPYSDTNEQVCFYVAAHTGSENLNVYYWTGSSWSSLGTIYSTPGWRNFTATNLGSATYTIRLRGASESGDTSQDSWNIDCMFLHTYNASNYNIDFEYQWTAAPYSDTNEQVCFYVAAHTGSENLNVYYWTGSSWSSLGTIYSTPGWRNFTATNLGSATYTIRLRGASESGDTSQDSWNIDCMFLHTWSLNYTLDLEVQWINVNFSFPIEQLCIKTGSLASENLRVDVWSDSSWVPLISPLLANQWNNISISSYLTSDTFTIRYVGTIEASDSSQSSWNIDGALLQLGANDYALDLEVQWTNVDFTREYEILRLNLQSSSATENIRVDVWNTETLTWDNLFLNLTYGWNDASIGTWLTSNTLTIRYTDTTSSSDALQDSWMIDAALLYLSTFTYEGNITSINIIKPSDTTWSSFNVKVNNTANSLFQILDQDGQPLTGYLNGVNNDISSISVHNDTIRLFGRFTGSVKLDSWSVTYAEDWEKDGTDTNGLDGWSWNFAFSRSGVYWFYSIGNKLNYSPESPPLSPTYDIEYYTNP